MFSGADIAMRHSRLSQSKAKTFSFFVPSPDDAAADDDERVTRRIKEFSLFAAFKSSRLI